MFADGGVTFSFCQVFNESERPLALRCTGLGVWFQAKSELIERRAEGQLRFDAKIRKKVVRRSDAVLPSSCKYLLVPDFAEI